ncbi:MAG: thioredoxin family protein [Nannocystaceae bacterium]|nr:thioredoxin family protein [Nannocystaceae bacterium]
MAQRTATRRSKLRAAVAIATLACAGCVGAPYDGGDGAASRPHAAPAAARAADKPEFVPVRVGEAGALAVITDAIAKARGEDRKLVVYLGASWCEPCQVFHRAVERGEFDRELAGVRFLEFDADVDAGALAEAGYGGKLIPRFVVPAQDGRGSDRRIEGGVKGERAAKEILARLGPVLGIDGA